MTPLLAIEVTDVAVLIAAVTAGAAGLITAFAGLLVALANNRKLDMAADKVITASLESKARIEEIHVLVDGRLSEALAKITQLEVLLAKAEEK